VIVISLATFAPPAIGVAADLTAAPQGHVLPPWYFLFLHQLVQSAPPKLLGVESAKFIIGALSFLGIGAIALPFVDRRGSRVTVVVGLVLVVLCLLLTAYALV
jgi:quinol-cytochrome oxidoreductase complex cytochrome b subunit